MPCGNGKDRGTGWGMSGGKSGARDMKAVRDVREGCGDGGSTFC